MRLLLNEPHVRNKEQQLLEFRRRATDILISENILPGTVGNTEPLGWPWLFEIYHCLWNHGILPNGITADDVRVMEMNLLRRWNIIYRDNTFRSMTMNHLHRQLSTAWHQAMNEGNAGNGGTDDPITEIQVYSAHDSTVFGILCDLEARYSIDLSPKGYIPPYASSICLSLYQEATAADGGNGRSNSSSSSSQWSIR
eukprot:CAMPEP_0170190714 /NCGR_PEP_ID=MMETSP0040_2-20121228/49971_1 /TAXON_ID=641309 /ORGANISM="Lotharella oceanica, Strain CCMP622" /LENGTH=196 /DNA_ID=CAMNT_0010438645 /DNA_START=15 /DNA_END=601 /DNA_ORIENTATION=+